MIDVLMAFIVLGTIASAITGWLLLTLPWD
jgi:hypothetical protein